MNNKDIIISIAADSSKFLKDMQQALASAEKQAKSSNISAIMEAKLKSVSIAIHESIKQFDLLLDTFSGTRLDNGAFDNISTQLENSLKTINRLSQEFQTYDIDIGKQSGNQLDTFINQLTNNLNVLNSQASGLKTAVQSINNVLQNIGKGVSLPASSAIWVELETKVNQIFNGTSKLDKRTKEYKKSIKEVIDRYDMYKNLGGSRQISDLADIKMSSTSMESTNTSNSINKKKKFIIDSLEDAYHKLSSEKKAFNEVSQYAEKASKSKQLFSESNAEVADSAKESSENIQEESKALKEVSESAEDIEDVKTTVENFSSILDKGWDILTNYVTSMLSIDNFIDILKKLASITNDLDDSLTKMQIATDKSHSSLKSFQKESFQIGKAIGVTSTNIQKSTTDFLKSGYQLEEAANLAKNVNLFANIADLDIDVSSKQLLSSIKTWGSEFNKETEACMSIIDRFSKVGSSYALNMGSIGDAMERTADALKTGGNNLNESLGIVATGSLMQQDMDSIAKMLEIFALRLRGSKAELISMGAGIDGMASSSGKLRQEILALSGVDIMANDSTYKSTAAIIQEIGAVFDTLSAMDQSSLLTMLAGDNNTDALRDLIHNYETLTNVIISMETAEGSALQKNWLYMDSISGRLSQFQNQLQEFASLAIEDDFLKKFVSLGTKLLELVTKFIDKFGIFSTLIASIGGALTFKNFGRVKMLPSL